MDVNDLRSLVTALSMICFAGIVIWAWRGSNASRFDEARHLPFERDAAPEPGDRA